MKLVAVVGKALEFLDIGLRHDLVGRPKPLLTCVNEGAKQNTRWEIFGVCHTNERLQNWSKRFGDFSLLIRICLLEIASHKLMAFVVLGDAVFVHVPNRKF